MRLEVWALILLATLPTCRAESSGQIASDSARPAALALAATPPTCGLGRNAILTGNGIGDLQVGALVTSIRQHCRVLADSGVEDDEGNPVQVLLVQLGPDTVSVTPAGGRVWRIEVETPRFRTADSLGVGSLVGAFRRFGDLKAVIGDGPYFLVTSSHCGMSFGLPPDAVTDTLDLVDLEGPELSHLADTLAVQSVLLYGCHPR
jgi:hypothetical protein